MPDSKLLAGLIVSCATLLACARPDTQRAPGSTFRDCADCPEMVVIAPGTFVMGSPASEAGRFEEEGPQHQVTFARSFEVSRAPITRAEYEAFARATSRPDPAACSSMNDDGHWVNTPGLSFRHPGFDQTADHPAVCVSWDDAHAYARWLTEKTGRPYRLPTEAEFEYAARAGSTAAFAWGAAAEDLCAHANGFDATAGRAHPGWPAAACDDGYAYTAPVRAFPTNAFGVYGAAGNVFQWTEDCFVDGGYAGAPADGSARTRDGCELRVIRGGSWLNSARGLRAAMRDRDRPGDRYTNVGFRVASAP